jgi:hypothetical protein
MIRANKEMFFLLRKLFMGVLSHKSKYSFPALEIRSILGGYVDMSLFFYD